MFTRIFLRERNGRVQSTRAWVFVLLWRLHMTWQSNMENQMMLICFKHDFFISKLFITWGNKYDTVMQILIATIFLISSKYRHWETRRPNGLVMLAKTQVLVTDVVVAEALELVRVPLTIAAVLPSSDPQADQWIFWQALQSQYVQRSCDQCKNLEES